MTLLLEDNLHAYLDGELPPPNRAALEAELSTDPVQTERLRLWAEQKDGLHRLFDPILDELVPPHLTQAARHRSSIPWPLLTRMAAALALVLLGGWGGWQLRGFQPQEAMPSTTMAGDAMSAHLVFAAEIRHPVEVAVADRAHLMAWLSKRLGSPLKVPDLEPAGYGLIGGRLLPASSGPAAQF
ncbi:MAG: anti-sigma factor, partial [Rhodospirillaceae bacterium]|nr:anti-sigma factor [Rhodospirillaceae bacterium]